MLLKNLQVTSHKIAVIHGFWDDPSPNIAEKLMLIVSEVSEALEDLRKGNMTTNCLPTGKPVGFASELADVAIRLADLAEYLGVDLAAECELKASYNSNRPYRHGKAF